ncbi:MAG: hypothetical protein GWP60_02090 [Gammaproteobacteria bacterium]|jgi:hypothetical protein|nr:hypothetical protein [Gammaproteobacteria bacterium]
MKSKSRYYNVPGLLLLALFVLAFLAACSGGNIDVAVGGVNLPPGSLPPFPNSEPVVAQGTITGLGDLTVNGTHYDADNASILVDSQPGMLSDLEIGHVVILTGEISAAGLTGQASTIHMHSRVTGPVETVDAGNDRLTVMSQTIRLGPDTHFSDDIDMATLAAGARVRISGYADAAGNIRATRVETAAANLPLQLVGEVSGLDIANLVFHINQLTVDYGNAVVIDLPDGAPANGMTVRMIGSLSDGLFVAEQLVSGPALTGNPSERVQLGGIVTRFASLADFQVNDTAAAADAACTFVNGNSSNLQLDARVTIDGEFDTSGKVRAEHITFGEIKSHTATLAYDLDGFTSISVPTVFGISITQGAEYSIEVIIDEAAADRVEVTKDGTTLTIALLSGDGQIETLDARVTMPVLDRIDLTGVVNARVYGFDQAEMAINVGNVSNLRGDALRIGHLHANVSGVSRMDLGDIRPIGQADIAVSGVSQATLNMDVGSQLSGSVSTGQGTGASALYYYGSNVVLDVVTGANASLIWLGETRP